MNWFQRPKLVTQSFQETVSILHDETTFYKQFTHDLLASKQEVVIESPFITQRRFNTLFPIFQKLVSKGVKVYILTRHPQEHDLDMELQAETAIQAFERLGVQVLLCDGSHHRKLAMIDRELLWEGSLNILSQSHSREFMRRIKSKVLTQEMYEFLNYRKLLI
jgi:phosphatidylserine/phosphatidylglycerophosphate/cardiolipin synthase-like enzyme